MKLAFRRTEMLEVSSPLLTYSFTMFIYSTNSFICMYTYPFIFIHIYIYLFIYVYWQKQGSEDRLIWTLLVSPGHPSVVEFLPETVDLQHLRHVGVSSNGEIRPL